MKHAGSATLDSLEELLTSLQSIIGLRERSRGVFYFRSKPFLHFHDDPTGLFADLKIGSDFQRMSVNSKPEHALLIKLVQQQLL
ncbi:hypothetical protein [Glaciimonas soli]|uniref:Uncharacterized protein n=1 Tax=Glaciimonas soli TaxID=2590999 RepID=A0A843YRD4_9BURK|nr:hypothetical protein [Glaciimonas soli]MQQ99285.1 hypothetical protein [Glaciimonas soli]